MKSLLVVLLFVSLIVLGDQVAFSALESRALPECSISTNCVRIDWAVEESNESFQEVVEIVASTKRTKIVEKNDRYMHAEVTSRLMHYVDDLEIMILADSSTLQIRSASRVGIGDLGVNRKRVVNLLNLLQAASG